MFTKLFDWNNRRKLARQNKIKIKQRKKAFYYLKLGYTFLKWCEKQFPNRHARKQFYYDILHHGTIDSKYVNLFAAMIDKYVKPKSKNIKIKKEVKK